MKDYVHAQIYWLPYISGGRRKYPVKGMRYCPIIKIDKNSTETEWSVDFICTEINEENKSIVKLSFLSLEAPKKLLKKGVRFSLFEGDKKVAEGIVL